MTFLLHGGITIQTTVNTNNFNSHVETGGYNLTQIIQNTTNAVSYMVYHIVIVVGHVKYHIGRVGNNVNPIGN